MKAATAKKKEKGVAFRQEETQRMARRSRDEPKFQTKAIDYSKMVTVRIDARTTIYARSGDDVEEVKRKYFKRLEDAKKKLLVK